MCWRPRATGAVTRTNPRRARKVLDAGETLFDAGEGTLGVVHQLLAGFGQAHRSRGAAHQRNTDGSLELGNAHADGGLGDPQAARRLGVAAGLGQHCEQVQV